MSWPARHDGVGDQASLVNLDGVGSQGHGLHGRPGDPTEAGHRGHGQGLQREARRGLHLSGLHGLGQIDGRHDGLRGLYRRREAHRRHQSSGGLRRRHRDRRHDRRPGHGGDELRDGQRHGHRLRRHRHRQRRTLVHRRQVHADDRRVGLLAPRAGLAALASGVSCRGFEAHPKLGVLVEEEVVGGVELVNLEGKIKT